MRYYNYDGLVGRYMLVDERKSVELLREGIPYTNRVLFRHKRASCGLSAPWENEFQTIYVVISTGICCDIIWHIIRL